MSFPRNAHITWVLNPSSENVTAYNVYEASSLLASVPATDTSYTAVGVITGPNSYTFGVSATNAAGEGPVTQTTLVVPNVPSAPTGVVAVMV